MISEEAALARILASTRPLPARVVSLGEALDAFVARDLLARLPLPLFDNSSMDGYAVVAASAREGAHLRLAGEQPAGIDRKLRLNSGEAIRILTGGPIPDGADAVVMQEETRVEDGELILEGAVEPGENIRRRGIDLAEGQKLVSAGERLRPQTLALLAAQGLTEVETGGRVRAAIIATGDELVSQGRELAPGQIYESNAVLVAAMLKKLGAEVVATTHCPDEAEAIENAVRAAAASTDVMIISGGVSVGARDLVKPALSAIGATIDLWRVAVKPGKPFLFGRARDCAIFGLPGNPVSAFVTFLLFVRPAILKLMGANERELVMPQVPAQLSSAVRNPSDRPHYVRGVLREGRFDPVGRQESHALFGLSRATALLRVGAGEELESHTTVTVLLPD